MKELEFTEPYWICDSCATKRGWTCELNGITLIEGRCGYCKTGVNEMLTPVRDFKKPAQGPTKTEGGCGVKPKIKVLWHEHSNYLGTFEIRKDGGLPLLAICDDEYKGINPFFTYPLSMLSWYGWHVLGEL